MRLRVNILGLIGALIGIVSLFLDWWVSGQVGENFSLMDFITSPYYSDPAYPNFLLFPIGSKVVGVLPISFLLMIVIMITTFVSIISAIGGIAQAFALVALFSASYGPPNAIGFYLAIISAIISITSIIRPLGIGYPEGSIGLKMRLLNIWKSPQIEYNI